MKLIYKPSYTDGYSKIAGQDVAMLICLPDNYNGTTSWPWMQFTHGKGQLGPGTAAALKTVFEGTYQAIPEDWKTAVDKYGIIGVIVNYNDFFQPGSWDFVYNYMRANYNTVPLPMGQGFSWGGGSLQKDYCTDIAHADRLACAVPIAPTIELNSGWDNVGKANLPVWFHVNEGDDVVGKSPAVNSAAAINKTAVIKAELTIYKQNGHGGTNEALSLTPPVGYGENVYEWYLDILKNGPRAPKTGTVTQPPLPPPPATSTVKPIVSYTITGTIAHLIGSKSTGYKEGYDGVWSLESAPTGITSKLVFPSGSSYIDATAQLPVEGTYVFKFTLKGADPVQMTVQRGTATPVEKKPASYSIALKLLTFDDGSTEAATAVITTGSGKTYTA